MAPATLDRDLSPSGAAPLPFGHVSSGIQPHANLPALRWRSPRIDGVLVDMDGLGVLFLKRLFLPC